MRFLVVLDELSRLDPKWDNSLFLIRELFKRGHQIFIADVPDLGTVNDRPFAACAEIIPAGGHSFSVSPRRRIPIQKGRVDAVLIRKEPPFDSGYLYMTYILEYAARAGVRVLNDPAGIRSANEKLAILDFPKWIPKTLISADPETILSFQKEIAKPIVLKPLDQKGGKGVFLLKLREKHALRRIRRASASGKRHIMVQEYLDKRNKPIEKRLVLLNGQYLTGYEKQAPKNDFRANLALGASWHATQLTNTEKKLLENLRPYLIERGLTFAGIDVLGERLIEINVTCPAGVREATVLYQDDRFVKSWADFVERSR